MNAAFVCGTLALDAIAGSRVCVGPNARTRAHQMAGIALLAAAVRRLLCDVLS